MRQRVRAFGYGSLAVLLLGLGLVRCADRGRPRWRTLTILAPAAPGGGWDQTARAMQLALRESDGLPAIQVVNVPGAGGIIGLAQLANAHEGDASTLMVTGLIMVGAILTNHSPVTLRDATPIARLTGEYEVLVVPSASPHKKLGDFIDAWRRSPGDLAIAGGSAGGTDHMLAGLLAKAVGVPVEQINYLPHAGGGESMASLLGNHVAAGVAGYGELLPFIEAGSLTPLAISSDERLPGVEIPTFLEQGVDLSLANWRGVAAAPGISDQERAEWVSLMDTMHASKEWKDALDKNSWMDMYLTGPELALFLDNEQARVSGVLQSIGLLD